MTQRINEKLGAWLLIDGHNQQLLADELSITRPTLSSRLCGKSQWKWEEVVRISKLTECTLNELACIDVSEN